MNQREQDMIKQFRLPSREYTTSARRYMREWKKFTKAVEQRLGVRVYAFDPNVAVCLHGSQCSAELPLWVARKIAGLDA